MKKKPDSKASASATSEGREAEEFERIAAEIAVELNADPADEEVQHLAVFEQAARRKT